MTTQQINNKFRPFIEKIVEEISSISGYAYNIEPVEYASSSVSGAYIKLIEHNRPCIHFSIIRLGPLNKKFSIEKLEEIHNKINDFLFRIGLNGNVLVYINDMGSGVIVIPLDLEGIIK